MPAREFLGRRLCGVGCGGGSPSEIERFDGSQVICSAHARYIEILNAHAKLDVRSQRLVMTRVYKVD